MKKNIYDMRNDIMYQYKYLLKMIYNNCLKIKLSELLFLNGIEECNILCEGITNYILDDYIRKDDIVILIDENDKDHKFTLFQFLIQLFFLKFNIAYKFDITSDWLFNINKEFIANYENYVEIWSHKIYDLCIKKKINPELPFDWILGELTEDMMKLSENISIITSPTIDLLDIVNFSNRNSEANKLLNTTLDDTKSYKELEIELQEKGKKFENIILNDKQNCLYPYIESNCLKRTQLTQVFIAVGPRSTGSNIVMSHIMTRSYLNGLQNIGDVIAEAELSNKALIYKKKFVGLSGYMSRETDLLCLNLKIDYDTDDCGTTHYVNYFVKDKNYLKFIVSKNIILENGKLHNVTFEDTHLIGTTVKLRSICFCKLNKRNMVCKTCYGNPLSIKRNMKIGGTPSIEVLNPATNLIMAVKHSSATNVIQFSDPEMLNLFDLEGTQLVLKKLLNPQNISIRFEKDFIEDLSDRLDENDDLDDIDDDDIQEDENEDEEFFTNNVNTKMINSLKIVTKIDPFNKNGNGEEKVYNMYLDGSFLVLSNEMLKPDNIKNIKIPIDSDEAILSLDSLKPGTPVFNIKYITKEASRFIKKLKDIIERPKDTWYYNDLDTPINKLTSLIIDDANLKNTEFVHIEPIIYKLTRKPDKLIERPDFSQRDPQYVLINLETGIFKGDLFSSLVFQEINKIFKDLDSYEERGEGIHDSQFRSTNQHDFKYMEKALKKSGIL